MLVTTGELTYPCYFIAEYQKEVFAALSLLKGTKHSSGKITKLRYRCDALSLLDREWVALLALSYRKRVCGVPCIKGGRAAATHDCLLRPKITYQHKAMYARG